MRSIHELSNEEKAILLHQLLPGEMRGFLAGLHHYAQQIIKEAAAKKEIAVPATISLEGWLAIAKSTERTIDKHINELCASPVLFAEKLFISYQGLFTLEYMQKHAAISGYRFRDAIKFLYDLKPYGKLPFQEDEK